MSAVDKNKLLLYADDSAMLVSARNKSDIENELSNDLKNVSHWLVKKNFHCILAKQNQSYLVQNRE